MYNKIEIVYRDFKAIVATCGSAPSRQVRINYDYEIKLDPRSMRESESSSITTATFDPNCLALTLSILITISNETVSDAHPHSYVKKFE